jgi:hypothetical protein
LFILKKIFFFCGGGVPPTLFFFMGRPTPRSHELLDKAHSVMIA